MTVSNVSLIDAIESGFSGEGRWHIQALTPEWRAIRRGIQLSSDMEPTWMQHQTASNPDSVMALPDWYSRLLNSHEPAKYPSANELIAFAGSPSSNDGGGGSIVGLIEPGWLNPLFLPKEGYSEAIYSYFHDLPRDREQSLQTLHAQVQGLNNNVDLYSFVLAANADGKTHHGSRNHWAAMHSLSFEQLTGKDAVKYYSSKGNLYAYDSEIIPKKSGGSGEFTLDILAARTYNQNAHIAIFIVPNTAYATEDGGALDLPDFRQAPFAAEASDLPLAVSASYLGNNSLAQKAEDSTMKYWRLPPAQLPRLYERIDNTGVVLTLSAGDKYSGLNFSRSASSETFLHVDSQLTSSPIFLAVGGSALSYAADSNHASISGATAWRDPGSSDNEGGDGGFAVSVAIPDSQRTSPWIQWFQRSYLQPSLADAWTQPTTGGTLLSWWDSKGKGLKLQHRKLSVRDLKFYDAANLKQGLNIAPAKRRHLPDLSNLAYYGDFVSVMLGGEVDFTRPDWAANVNWNGDGGTSLASPATAAIIAAANARRRQGGLADLSASELQYMLYQISPGILTDVTALQHEPRSSISGYNAYPGYDFTSGLGSVGTTGSISLIDYLATNKLALLPQGSGGAADFAFKPSRLPVLLQKMHGGGQSLQLVALNGAAVAELLQAEANDPSSVQAHFLDTLRAAEERSRGQAHPVEFSLLELNPSWSAAAPESILARPISEFLQAEGVAIEANSRLDLGSLPDVYPSRGGAAFSTSPAYYSLLVSDNGSDPQPLRLRPFASNRGALLGQGGLLISDDGDQRASLVLSPLQRPLLVADVAESEGSPQPGASLQLWLAGSSQSANLYGVYPVLDAAGSLRDGEGNPVKPGEPGYTALAIQAAFGDGSASTLWEVPQAGARSIRNTQRWAELSSDSGSGSDSGAEGVSLLRAIQPGKSYHHLIVTLPKAEERRELIGRLKQNRLSAADQERIRVTGAAVPSEGIAQAVGLRQAGAFQSLGFEDGPASGDQDFNDVLASWSAQDITAQIGSLCLVDTNADRVVEVAAGSQAGTVSSVVVVSTDNSLTLQIWQPFGASDSSGVLVASGDVNGDGFDDVVAVRAQPSGSAGAAAGDAVAVLLGGKDYRNLDPTAPLATASQLNLQPSAALGSGPLSLAVRDLNADGYAEILLTAATGAAGRDAVPLEVWSMASGSFEQLPGLNIPASANLNPAHGYRLAVGDLNGDGQAEVALGDAEGADLFVGSVQLETGGQSFSFSSSVVLQPYGSSYSGGLQPTIVSAQQTLTQRPTGLAADSLPWALSLPAGVTAGPTQPLLGGLGTAGALVISSGEASDPKPSQVPLTWLSGGNNANDPLVPIPWSPQAGAPIFASGGVLYPQPEGQEMNEGIPGAPSPVLVSAASGTTSIELYSATQSSPSTGGGSQSTATPSWAPIAASSNSIDFSLASTSAGTTRTQQQWTQLWSEPQFSPDGSPNREIYGLATTDLVSYQSPFVVNLNPLNLAAPETLIADLQGHLQDYIDSVVIPWDQGEASNKNTSAWGPGAPNSVNFPYGSSPSTNLPTFKPNFTPQSATPTQPAPSLVNQYQQRLVMTALSNMGINYQHHYSPLWYSPASWGSNQEPTLQLKFLPVPEGRQTQGLDCTDFSSWYYNLAFGFWLNSDTADQAALDSVAVSWQPGTTIQPDVVLEASSIYTTNSDDKSILALLNATLQPGDILYLSGVSIKPGSAPSIDTATHAILWLNDNSDGSTFRFVDLADTAPTPAGASSQPAAFVIDSTGSESYDHRQQNYPNGVQIREFDSNIWYFTNILAVHRWLTEENVQILDYSPGATTINGVNLGSTSLGYAIRSGDGKQIPVTFAGGAVSSSDPGNGWSAHASKTTSKGYALYWRNGAGTSRSLPNIEGQNGDGRKGASQQAARWNLNASGAYESGYYLSGSALLSEEAAIGLDLDGDGYTAGPSTIDGLNLGSTAEGYALRRGNSAPMAVTYPGGHASASNPGDGWSAVAAAPFSDGANLYWRQSGSQQVARWQLNASGAYESGSFLNAQELASEEAELNLDLNGDGIIAVSLGATAEGYGLFRAGQSPLQVAYPGGNASASNPGEGWSATAVALSGEDYLLYWANRASQQTARWRLDASGRYQAGEYLAPEQLLEQEASLQRDLNGDGFTAGPSTIAGLNLGSTSLGYGLQQGTNAPIQVSWPAGLTSADNPGNGWRATAAVPTATGSDLYWTNEAAAQQARWSLDASGAYQTGTFLSGDQLYSEEASLNADLNGDAIIGAAFSTLDNQGNTTLLRRNDGQAFVETADQRFRVSSPFNLGTGDASSTWQMLAAETVDDQNQILWRNNAADVLDLWSLDSGWHWQSSTGPINPFSPAALELETRFQVDGNRDGLIG